MEIAKGTADENIAGALTKHVGSECIRKHTRDTHQVALEGRRTLAPATEC